MAVVSSASTSLDGYVAKADNTIGELFDWLGNGSVEIETASPGITMHLSPASAAHWRAWTGSLGALVLGRTLFDITDGWGGRHTLDVPVVVVTHEVTGHPPALPGTPGSAAGWAVEHGRHVVEQLRSAVEGAALDELEPHVGVAVVDAVLPGHPGDHREHDQAEPVDEPRGEQ